MNKSYKRAGSLFEKNFRRKVVSSENYFQKLIFYIHNNPVHHRFTTNIIEYPWTSYGTITSTKQTKLQRTRVIASFNDLENFIYDLNPPILKSLNLTFQKGRGIYPEALDRVEKVALLKKTSRGTRYRQCHYFSR